MIDDPNPLTDPLLPGMADQLDYSRIASISATCWSAMTAGTSTSNTTG